MEKVELIDRAAAINAIASFCKADNDCKEFEGEKCAGCEYYFCVREISKLPTIDAAPVRRGEWVLSVRDEGWNCGWTVDAKCSECGLLKEDIWGAYFPGVPEDIIRTTAIQCARSIKLDKFCPECGADMRPKEDALNG